MAQEDKRKVRRKLEGPAVEARRDGRRGREDRAGVTSCDNRDGRSQDVAIA